jgi:hypothetical protein
MKNGYYIDTYEDGSKYEGEWKNGKQHGRGVYYRSNGTIAYEGDFKNGKMHGYGVYYYDDDDDEKYEGW